MAGQEQPGVPEAPAAPAAAPPAGYRAVAMDLAAGTVGGMLGVLVSQPFDVGAHLASPPAATTTILLTYPFHFLHKLVFFLRVGRGKGEGASPSISLSLLLQGLSAVFRLTRSDLHQRDTNTAYVAVCQGPATDQSRHGRHKRSIGHTCRGSGALNSLEFPSILLHFALGSCKAVPGR